MGFSGVICSFLTMPISAESWRLFRAVPAWSRTVVVNVVHRVQRAHGVRPVQFAPFGPEALKRRRSRARSKEPESGEAGQKKTGSAW